MFKGGDMKLYLTYIGTLLALVLFTTTACNLDDNLLNSDNSQDNSAFDNAAFSKVGKGGMIWADDQLFATIGTPAHFKPGNGPFDELYNVAPAGTAFKDGVTAISESKPGDKDFNGGRWHVNVLKAGVSLNKYLNASSAEDLDLDDFMGTDIYFECPLRPRNNKKN
jgi:hypothetical protein